MGYWISASIRYTFKNKPKGQAGMSGENISIAAREPTPLSRMIVSLVRSLVEFYLEATDMPTDEMNREIDAALEALKDAKVRDVPSPAPADK